MTTATPTSLRIAPDVSVMSSGLLYVITHVVSSSDVIARRADTGALEALSIHLLEPVDIQDHSSTKESGHRDLSMFSEKEWREAEMRLQTIRPLLNLSRRTIEDVNRVAKQAKVHVATIYAWLNLYEDGGEVTSLIPQRSGRKAGVKLVSTAVEVVIDTVINEAYLNEQKLRPKDISDEVLRRCKLINIQPPHPNTVRNRLKRLPPNLVLRRRGRKDLARNLYAPVLGEFPGANHPLAVVQIDHSRCDVVLVDDVHRKAIGRPWLTLAIDVYSRMVVGYYLSFETPNATATGMCLARAILPKEGLLASLNINGKWPVYGFMQVVHADNAKEFRGSMLRRACENYQIDLQLRPVKTPHYGGHIERMMGTVSNELRKLPGATFHNPEARKGYDSDANAALTLSEYEEYLLDFFVNVYHQRLHQGIQMSPAKKWEIGLLGDGSTPGIGLPMRPLNAERILIDFLPYVERTIQTYGVQIDDLQYWSEALNHWINAEDAQTGQPRKFIFRRDPRDISSIYFFDPAITDYIKIPTRELSLPAMSFAEYREVRARLKQEGRSHIDEQSIAAAVERLREKIAQATSKTKAARRSTQTVQRNREIAAQKITAPLSDFGRLTVEQVNSIKTTLIPQSPARAKSQSQPQPSFAESDIFLEDVQPFDHSDGSRRV